MSKLNQVDLDMSEIEELKDTIKSELPPIQRNSEKAVPVLKPNKLPLNFLQIPGIQNKAWSGEEFKQSAQLRMDDSMRTYFQVSEEMLKNQNMFKVMFEEAEMDQPENIFDLQGNESRRAQVEVVKRTRLSLTPDKCYELDHVLENEKAENNVKLTYVQRAFEATVMDAEVFNSEFNCGDDSPQVVNGHKMMLGAQQKFKEFAYNIISISPGTETHDWFQDDQDLFGLLYDKFKELEKTDQTIEGIFVSACQAWIEDNETDPQIQNANFISNYYNHVVNKKWHSLIYRDMMDRDQTENRTVDLQKEESFFKTLETRKVKQPDHLNKVLKRIREASKPPDNDDIPVVFDILRLSLNVKQTKPLDSLDVRDVNGAEQQSVLLAFNLISVNFRQLEDDSMRTKQALDISRTIVSLGRCLQTEAMKKNHLQLKNTLALIKPQDHGYDFENVDLAQSCLEIADFLQAKEKFKAKLVGVLPEDSSDWSFSISELSQDAMRQRAKMGHKKKRKKKARQKSQLKTMKTMGVGIKNVEAATQTVVLSEESIFHQLLQVLYQRGHSVFQFTHLGDEILRDAFQQFRDFSTNLVEFLMDKCAIMNASDPKNQSSDGNDRSSSLGNSQAVSKGDFWKKLQRLNTAAVESDTHTQVQRKTTLAKESEYNIEKISEYDVPLGTEFNSEDLERGSVTSSYSNSHRFQSGSSESDQSSKEENGEDYWRKMYGEDQWKEMQQEKIEKKSQLSRRSKKKIETKRASNELSKKNFVQEFDEVLKIDEHVHSSEEQSPAIRPINEDSTPRSKENSDNAVKIINSLEIKQNITNPDSNINSEEDHINVRTSSNKSKEQMTVKSNDSKVSKVSKASKVSLIKRNKIDQVTGVRTKRLFSPKTIKRFIAEASKRDIKATERAKMNQSVNSIQKQPQQDESKRFAQKYFEMYKQEQASPEVEDLEASKGTIIISDLLCSRENNPDGKLRIRTANKFDYKSKRPNSSNKQTKFLSKVQASRYATNISNTDIKIKPKSAVREKAFASSLQMDRFFMQQLFTPQKQTKKLQQQSREEMFAHLKDFDPTLLSQTMDDIISQSSFVTSPQAYNRDSFFTNRNRQSELKKINQPITELPSTTRERLCQGSSLNTIRMSKDRKVLESPSIKKEQAYQRPHTTRARARFTPKLPKPTQSSQNLETPKRKKDQEKSSGQSESASKEVPPPPIPDESQELKASARKKKKVTIIEPESDSDDRSLKPKRKKHFFKRQLSATYHFQENIDDSQRKRLLEIHRRKLHEAKQEHQEYVKMQEAFFTNKAFASKVVVTRQRDLTNKIVEELIPDQPSFSNLNQISPESKTCAYIWGINDKGQLGKRDLLYRQQNKFFIDHPMSFKEKLNVIRMGYQHGLGIGAQGELISWGQNRYGQCGRDIKEQDYDAVSTDDEHGKRQQPDSLENPDLVSGVLYKVKILDICCGWDHSMATTISGLLFTWGQNVYGELGIGNYHDQDQPVPVELLHHYKVIQMSAGKHHSAAVTNCGKLFMWGANPDKRLMKKTEFYKYRKVPKNYFFPQEITIANKKSLEVNIQQVACGMDHTLVLDVDGVVYSSGNGRCGQLGINPSYISMDQDAKPYITVETFTKERRPCKKIAAGREFSVALSEKGVVYTCGLNSHGRLGHQDAKRPVCEFKPILWFSQYAIQIKDISAGDRHVLAVSVGNHKSSSRSQEYKPCCYVWGNNYYGQLGKGYIAEHILENPGITQINHNAKVDIQQISAGYATSALIQTELKVAFN